MDKNRITEEMQILCVREPQKNIRLLGSQVIKAYLPSWAQEKRVGLWVSKEQGQFTGWGGGQRFGKQMLAVHVDKPFWYKTLSLVIAPFMVQDISWVF